MSIVIEEFDKGEIKMNDSLVPSTMYPDALYIPTRLVHQPNNSLSDASCKLFYENDNMQKNNYYFNAIKVYLVF
jgi:hypothetical protein